MGADGCAGIHGYGGTASGTGRGGRGGYFLGGNAANTHEGGTGLEAVGGESADGGSTTYDGVGIICTGGTHRAPIHLTPRSDSPPGGQKGDLYVDDFGVLYSCVGTGTTGAIWQAVGLQT
jgi:hypothetical protein